MIRVGVTDYVNAPFELERLALGDGFELVDLQCHSEADLLAADLASLDALLVWHAPITAAVASRLSRCKVVVRYGVGYDAIDVAALTRHGIGFANTPDYGTEEVADTACAMILQHVRRIGEYDANCRHYQSGWQEHTLAPLARTSTRTLGIIGVGRIGTAVMQRMRAFGFHLLGFDPYQPSGHEKAIGYERLDSLSELLARADVVSLHCPANQQTRGLVDEAFLAAMKPGSILVNTARGTLLASLDPLYQALQSGHLLAAALDVLPDEPPQPHVLISAWRERADWLAGRLTINPHSAYYSAQAWAEMRSKAAETVRLWFQHGQLRNRVER